MLILTPSCLTDFILKSIKTGFDQLRITFIKIQNYLKTKSNDFDPNHHFDSNASHLSTISKQYLL